MRFRIIALTVVAAALGVSVATAAPTKGKPDHSGANCKPRVGLVLKGTVASAFDASASSFGMNVSRANHHGRAYVKAAQPLTIMTDANTRVVKGGSAAKVTDLAVGDKILVKSRACRADLKGGATPQLTAQRVVVQAPEQAEPSK
jgi:hypothetical protein